MHSTSSREQPYTAGDFRTALEALSRPRSGAVFMAALCSYDLTVITSLTWRAAFELRNQGRLDDISWSIVQSQPRHMKSVYVFWEDDADPKPLFGLDRDVMDTFGMTWADLLHVFQTMSWVDRKAEADDFASLLNARLQTLWC